MARLMRVRFNGETRFLALTHNKTYEVLAVEKGWYRIIDDSGEDYLYPPEDFTIIDNILCLEKEMEELRKKINNYWSESVSVLCKNGQIINGTFVDWTSALDNAPDPESITIESKEEPLIGFVEIFLHDIEDIIKGRGIMEYEEYEKECNKIRKDNEKYLAAFRYSLEESGLSTKTINSHLGNVDFYINEFLMRYEPTPMIKGCHSIGAFLGDFFIRKCMWSTPNNIKTTAASIKKFYKCMLDAGEINKTKYDDLCETIKRDMEEWQEDCRRFDNLDEDDLFVFDDEDFFKD